MLLFAVVAEFHDRWRLVNALTTFNYRNKELTEFVGSAKNLGLFPGVNRVEDHHSFFRIEFLICKADQIGLDLAGLFAVDTVYSLVARVGNLFCVFGKLDLRLEGILRLTTPGSVQLPSSAGWVPNPSASTSAA